MGQVRGPCKVRAKGCKGVAASENAEHPTWKWRNAKNAGEIKAGDKDYGGAETAWDAGTEDCVVDVCGNGACKRLSGHETVHQQPRTKAAGAAAGRGAAGRGAADERGTTCGRSAVTGGHGAANTATGTARADAVAITLGDSESLAFIDEIIGTCNYNPGTVTQSASIDGLAMDPHFLVAGQQFPNEDSDEPEPLIRWVPRDRLLECFRVLHDSDGEDSVLITVLLGHASSITRQTLWAARAIGLGGTRHCAQAASVQAALEQATEFANAAEELEGPPQEAGMPMPVPTAADRERAMAAAEVMVAVARAAAGGASPAEMLQAASAEVGQGMAGHAAAAAPVAASGTAAANGAAASGASRAAGASGAAARSGTRAAGSNARAAGSSRTVAGSDATAAGRGGAAAGRGVSGKRRRDDTDESDDDDSPGLQAARERAAAEEQRQEREREEQRAFFAAEQLAALPTAGDAAATCGAADSGETGGGVVEPPRPARSPRFRNRGRT